MVAVRWTDHAWRQLGQLRRTQGQQRRCKAVLKAIGLLVADPGSNLQVHEFTSLRGPDGEKVFEAYAEQATPATYRVFWYKGAPKGQVTVIAITPHP